MQSKTFWVVRSRRHQDYVQRTPNGIKLRFDSPEEAQGALKEAMQAHPREGWEITEIHTYLQRTEGEASPPDASRAGE